MAHGSHPSLAAGALTAACLTAAPAAAIVNIEDVRPRTPEPGFSGEAAFAANGQSGNTDKRTLSLGARAQWRSAYATDFVVFNVDSGTSSGVRDTDRRFLHARHVGDLGARRAWEAFGQLEKNRFTRLSRRGLLGGGLRWELWREGERAELVAGLGAFHSRETLEPREGTTDAGTDTLWRLNVYLVVKLALNDQVRVASTTYYQPATEAASDFRLLEQAALVVRLNELLDLKLALDVAHDSSPPQLVRKTDTVYRTGIEYRF